MEPQAAPPESEAARASPEGHFENHGRRLSCLAFSAHSTHVSTFPIVGKHTKRRLVPINPPSSLGSSWPPSTSCRGHADDPEASDEWDMWCLSLSEHSILRAHPRRGTCQHTSWHVSAHAVAHVSTCCGMCQHTPRHVSASPSFVRLSSAGRASVAPGPPSRPCPCFSVLNPMEQQQEWVCVGSGLPASPLSL